MRPDLDDVARVLQRPPRDHADDTPSHSAVAVILTPAGSAPGQGLEDGPEVWFIRRAPRRGDPWSGHVGFPGGRAEAIDAHLRATAQRETWEELGVALPDAHWLGRLDDLRTRPVRSLMVRPHVFALDAVPDWTPNHEVADVFHTTLGALMRGTDRTTMRWPAGLGVTLPKVDIDGHVLWGLSLQIVDDLLDRLDGLGTGLARNAALAQAERVGA